MQENNLKNKKEITSSGSNSSIFNKTLKTSFRLNKNLYQPNNKLPLINLNSNKNTPEILKIHKINQKFLINQDPKLLKYYQQLCSTKSLDKFPNDCDIRRFIILNLNTFETKENKVKISSITAIEIKNMELTGMIYHSYLNCDLLLDGNSNNDNFLYTLFDYCKEKNNNDKKSLEKLLEFIDNSIVILHNVLNQIKILNSELSKYDLKTININCCICTLRMLRVMKFNNQNLKNIGYKISDLCNLYDIKIKENDFSLIKTIALARCVIKMMKKDLENNNTIEIQDMNDNFEEEEGEENNKKSEMSITEKIKNKSEIKLNILKNMNNNLTNQRKNTIKNFTRFNKNFNFNDMCNKTTNDFHLFFSKKNNDQSSYRTKSYDLKTTINNRKLCAKNKILDGYNINCIHNNNYEINEENCDENFESLSNEKKFQ